MIKIASGANCLPFTEPGPVLNAFHSSLTHSPNNMLMGRYYIMMRILQMKKPNQTKKAQQNHAKLRDNSVLSAAEWG